MNMLSCRGLWKIFGPHPARVLAAHQRSAALTPDPSPKGRGEAEAAEHVVAVRDVSFQVRQGEVFCIMGLSGSGKSTLLRCLTRLIEPTAGELYLDGIDVMALSESDLLALRRQKASMVFQRFALFPHRTVLDNVVFGLEVQGLAHAARLKRANEMLDLVGLTGWGARYPHELSGGMQQRVGLARALAVDPQLLLCDEPFSALDPLIRREMQGELLRLQRELHKTIIFITHDFLEAIRLGDRIAIMRNGSIVQTGTPELIVARPADDYVRAFTQDVPRELVLTAGSVMRARRGQEQIAERAVALDMALAALIPLTAAHDDPLAVRDAGGSVVGVIDRAQILLALAGTE